MNAFLYYVPGHTQQIITPADVVKAKLGYAFPKGTPAICNAMPGTGPDGNVGAIWTNSERYQYVKDAQVWEQHEGDGYWVGYWKDAKPGPDGLLRDKPLDGEYVELADGNLWLVPRARRWSMEDDPEAWPRWSHTLPRRLKFNTNPEAVKAGDCPQAGVVVEQNYVVEKYAELWAIAEVDFRQRYSSALPEDDAFWTNTALYLNVVKVLTTNYVLGPVEANLLGLFDSESYQKVLDALGDWESWRDMMQKKRETHLAMQPSSSGVEGNSLNTDQPSLT